jgi:hypothetical protein
MMHSLHIHQVLSVEVGPVKIAHMSDGNFCIYRTLTMKTEQGTVSVSLYASNDQEQIAIKEPQP